MELPYLQKIETKKRLGLVVVITGYGKGKTTTAIGLAVRAIGHGFKVCIIQFMKGDLYTGEIDGLKRLEPDVELIRTGKGFCGIQGNPYPYEEHRLNAQEAIKLAKEKIISGEYQLIVLDEINNALHLKLIDLNQVIDLIENKPEMLHLVLTGRDAHPEIIKRAHTVTEMVEVKHAYKLGIEPQQGIDY